MKSGVSIIIPTFNRAPLLKRAIQSALNSTEGTGEIIVVDDGSTDDTNTVLRSFGNAINVVHQSNKGASAARNTGLQHTSSDYVIFLDSDDFFEGNFASQIVEEVRAHDLDFCVGRTKRLFPNGVRGFTKNSLKISNTLEIYERFYFDIHAQTGAFVWRKDFLIENGAWDESLTIADDTELFYRMLLAGARGFSIPAGYVVYDCSHYDNRLTSTKSESAFSAIVASFTGLASIVARSNLPSQPLGRAVYELGRLAAYNGYPVQADVLFPLARKLGFSSHLGSQNRQYLAKMVGPRLAWNFLGRLDRLRNRMTKAR